jgi:hypothetical protein
MAKRQTIQMFDDLDGQPIDEDGATIRFGLDGRAYEIDLSTENAAKLRETLAPFIERGRSVGARSRTSGR